MLTKEMKYDLAVRAYVITEMFNLREEEASEARGMIHEALMAMLDYAEILEERRERFALGDDHRPLPLREVDQRAERETDSTGSP